MSIDRNRYRAFIDDLDRLSRTLSAEQIRHTIEARLVDWLARQDLDALNLSAIEQAVRDLFTPEARAYIENAFEAYRATLRLVNQHYDDLPAEITRDLQRIRAIEQIAAQEWGNYSTDTIRSLADALRESVTRRERVQEFADRIQPISARVERYAVAIAQTQLKTVARAAKNEKARIGGVEFFEYVGLRRDSNRMFCHLMIGQTVHLSTIAQLRNGNREPVHDNCGGWRCIHDLEPDPFADSESEGTLYTVEEGTRLLRVYGVPTN